MPPSRAVVIRETKDDVVALVSARFVSVIRALHEGKQQVHVCLTGGTLGIAILRAVARDPESSNVDWKRVHFWWGDERWLPHDDAERNDKQATDALLSLIDVPEDNIHRFAASDGSETLDAAAGVYRAELARLAEPDAIAPVFDITFLGVGPDGHVASLFPHFEQVNAEDAVVAVRDSPKPPPERLSLTFPVINNSDRIWLALAGADKASAIGLALAGASRNLVPVAGVRARLETVFFVDSEAATDVPRELVIDL
ncbi:6-phosphogluconolactonase [Salinibacterium sp. SYSU T00001]|uniref:6-phosphogluconolactonase n=1 Tax=Homoserinimonas sedimenticola TaxID=2986805 RepID=UPI002235A9F8|nr:6-phosphogluconolactonase [Salinibacterium sedimenticola]MCW4384401.1 6-phosphogluconolactonase [Salinibacterium sedimenticola]